MPRSSGKLKALACHENEEEKAKIRRVVGKVSPNIARRGEETGRCAAVFWRWGSLYIPSISTFGDIGQSVRVRTYLSWAAVWRY